MAATDLLTTTEAKAAIGKGVSDATQGTLLAQYVTAVSEKLVDCCGPIVQSGTVSEVIYPAGAVYLAQYPVASVTSVDSSALGSLSASDFRLVSASGKLERLVDGIPCGFPSGGTITAVYTPGRCASTATVPDKFKLAASQMLKNAWRANEPAVATVGEFEVPRDTFPRFAVPNSVKELLGREWQSGSGVGD